MCYLMDVCCRTPIYTPTVATAYVAPYPRRLNFWNLWSNPIVARPYVSYPRVVSVPAVHTAYHYNRYAYQFPTYPAPSRNNVVYGGRVVPGVRVLR